MAPAFLIGILRRRRDEEEQLPSVDGSLEGDSSGLASLKHFEKMHRLDPNLPLDELEEVDIAIILNQQNAEKGAEIEQVLNEDNSPYPEVRSHPRNMAGARGVGGCEVKGSSF